MRAYEVPQIVEDEWNRTAQGAVQTASGQQRIPSKRSIAVCHVMPKREWVGEYKNSLTHLPGAIVVGRGWSLNHVSAVWIKHAQSRGWYTMVAAQALPKMRELKLAVDAVCAMDPQDHIVRYIQDLRGEKVFADCMSDRAWWDVPGMCFFSQFSAHVHDAVLRKSRMHTFDVLNQTVSEVMQCLVQYMGARAVMCVGMDYCTLMDGLDEFTGNRDRVTGKPLVYRDTNTIPMRMNGHDVRTHLHYAMGLISFTRNVEVPHMAVEEYPNLWREFEHIVPCRDEDRVALRAHPSKTGRQEWKRFIYWRGNLISKHQRMCRINKIACGLPESHFGKAMVEDFSP